MLSGFENGVRRRISALFLLFIAIKCPIFAQENVVMQWNNAAIQSIRYLRPWPTIGARALAIAHTCMYDAWTAYDDKAVATTLAGQVEASGE